MKNIWNAKLGSARSSYLLSQVDMNELTKVLVNLYKFDRPEHFWKDYTKSDIDALKSHVLEYNKIEQEALQPIM